MFKVIQSLLVFVFTIFFTSSLSFAVTAKDYDYGAFKKAQSEGKQIIVDVYAGWCPTCKKQNKQMSKWLAGPSYKNFIKYRLYFKNKSELRTFAKSIGKPISRQSTIVVFKGNDLKAFSVAETGSDLKAKIDKAL